MKNLYSTSELENRLQELIERVNETNDEVFIDIANEEIGYINEDIEYYEKNYSNKEDKKSDFEDVWERMDEFVEDYLDTDIYEVKVTAINTLRYEIKSNKFDLSKLKTNKKTNNNKNNPGRESLNYTGYVFNAKYTCLSCGNMVFINNIKDHVICPHCQVKKELNTKWWKNNLFGKHLLKEAVEIEENTMLTTSIFDNYKRYLSYGNEYPRCKNCKGKLSEKEYWTIAEIEEATSKGSIKCKKCKKPHSIRKPDNFVNSLFEFPVIAIINEEQSTNNTSKTSTNTTTIKCNSCGANLKIQKNKHTSICEYCNTENILPDSLFKPDTPIQYTFNVLLKQKHKTFLTKINEENIDNEYLALKQILDIINKDDDEITENNNENKKKKNHIKSTLDLILTIIFSSGLVGALVIWGSFPDYVLGYEEEIIIENTDYSYVKSHDRYVPDSKGRWGVINNTNNELIIPTEYNYYKDIKYLYKDYFIVRNYKKYYGIINSKNALIIPFNYSKIEPVTYNNKSYLLLKSSKGEELYYNFNMIISNKYSYSIKGNYFEIKDRKTRKYGLADTLGNIVLPTKYFNIISVNNNKAKVQNSRYGKTYSIDIK